MGKVVQLSTIRDYPSLWKAGKSISKVYELSDDLIVVKYDHISYTVAEYWSSWPVIQFSPPIGNTC